MSEKKILSNIRNYILTQIENNRTVQSFQATDDTFKNLQKTGIGVRLDAYKDVILKEETGLELGGMNKKSFLLIYPINESNLLKDGNIILIGPEINAIRESTIDFGILLLVSLNKNSSKELKDLNSFSFISNSIEGFSIRSIPRKFWSRISKDTLKKGFSFALLGSAIEHLYRLKFDNQIEAIELIFISSSSDDIIEFLSISTDLIHNLNKKWLKKLDNWKKRIDCDYDWGCEICPYQVECYEIKKVLVARNKREE